MASKPSELRTHRSITELQDECDSGKKKPLEDQMRAWKGIKELPPDDPEPAAFLRVQQKCRRSHQWRQSRLLQAQGL